ncbi:hypothetical protein ACJ72_01069 [Emergomyces africanus]|uniref:Triacylglycerol lipase n=1 Tax=Emergomyces africanus TaxID=1955775 RepID=A0A1B7P698_9EURO|nr:hypothetical protein ACJ72_01069 [Emergomyces africanus]
MTLASAISRAALHLSATTRHGLPPQLLNPRAALSPEDETLNAPPAAFEDATPGSILRHRNTLASIAVFNFAPVNLDGTYQLLDRKALLYQFAGDATSPNCAPSYAKLNSSEPGGRMGTATTHAEFILGMAALERGWVVTTTDFEGSNAAFLPNIRDANVAMWGYSGGSLASGFAAELQPSYAPELWIVGAALGGTVPNIKTALNADICTYVKGGEAVFDLATVNRVMAENSIRQHTPDIPLLVYNAVKDEISWVNDITALTLLWLDDRFKHITPQKGCVSSTKFTPLESPKAFGVLSETIANLLLSILYKPIGN